MGAKKEQKRSRIGKRSQGEIILGFSNQLQTEKEEKFQGRENVLFLLQGQNSVLFLKEGQEQLGRPLLISSDSLFRAQIALVKLSHSIQTSPLSLVSLLLLLTQRFCTWRGRERTKQRKKVVKRDKNKKTLIVVKKIKRRCTNHPYNNEPLLASPASRKKPFKAELASPTLLQNGDRTC